MSWVGTGGSLPQCGSVGMGLKGSVVKLSGKRAGRSPRRYLSFPAHKGLPFLKTEKTVERAAVRLSVMVVGSRSAPRELGRHFLSAGQPEIERDHFCQPQLSGW